MSFITNSSSSLSGLLEDLFTYSSGVSGYHYNSFYGVSNPNNFVSSGNFISGISITGGIALKNNLNINAGNNITLTQQGLNILSIASADGSSNISGLISTGNADLRYLSSGSSGSFYLTTNPNNYISSNSLNGLISTGSADLRYLSSGFSGEVYKVNNNLNFSSSGNVELTGTALQNQLSNYYLKTNPNEFVKSGEFISGISITGGASIRGPFNINAGTNITLTQQGLNILSISSAGGGGNLAGLISTGDADLRYLTSGSSGSFYLTSNPSNYITNSNLNGLISSGSSNLTYLQTGASGSFYLTTNPNSYITSSNLAGLGTTGSLDLRYLASGSSGQFYLTSNPSNYITNSNLNGLISSGSANLQYLVTGASGDFYRSSNPSNYITNTNLNGLISTGSANLTYLTTGSSGSFYLTTNPSNYINSSNLNGLITTGSSDLRYLVSGASGQFYLTTNPNNYISSSNLNGLISTGSADNRYIFSGFSGEVYKVNNPLNFVNSGNLETTGTNIQNQINIIKNLNYVTGISITGGIGITGTLLFTGQNINVIQSGNTILFSGNLPGAAGGGEANTASNLSPGSGWFAQKAGVDLQFKSLNVQPNLNISGNSNTLTLDIKPTGMLSGLIGELISYGMGFTKTARNITNNSTTQINITGLSFYANPFRTYGYEAFIPFMTNTATCGLTLSINGPTGIGNNAATGLWSSEIMLSIAAGTDSYQSISRVATPTVSGIHTTASVAPINHPHFAKIMGCWVCKNQSGTVQVKFAPEVNTNVATIIAGAWLKYF